MLPHEVEPFANAHIERLGIDIAEMEFYIANPEEINSRIIQQWRRDLMDCANGFERFKVCMVDELEQKERALQTLRDHEIRPNQKAGS